MDEAGTGRRMSPPLPQLPGVRHAHHELPTGVRLHVAESGDPGAPAVLAVHGWPQHWWAWRGVIPALAASHRVICPDLRGFGWSGQPEDGDFAKERLADDMLALLDVLGIERAGYLGHPVLGPALVRDGRVVRKALEGAMPAADAAIFAEVVSEPERAHASSLLYRHFQLRDLPALAEQAAAVGEARAGRARAAGGDRARPRLLLGRAAAGRVRLPPRLARCRPERPLGAGGRPGLVRVCDAGAMRTRLLLVVVLLLAGCGGGEEDAAPAKRGYERAVRAAVADARDAGGTPAALREAAERLRALEPPAEVERPHRDLVAGFDAIASANERGVEPPDAVVDRLLAARRAFAARRYDIGVYGPLSGS
jgi:hypothetical protein